MIQVQYNNLLREPREAAVRLLEALAASSRVVLTGEGRVGLLSASGRLSLLSGDSLDFVQPLIEARLLDIGDVKTGDRREAARIVRATLLGALAQEYLPTLRSSARLPCFVRRGDRLEQPPPGFSPQDQAHFAPAGLPLLPEPDPAYPHLHELLSGLCFAKPFHRANLLGSLLAAFCRPAIAEFPLLLLEADAKSCGKTSTARAMSWILTGHKPVSVTFSGAEDTMESKLGHLAGQPGPSYILVDNIRPKRGASTTIRSQFLSSATSDHLVGVRALYKGTVPIFDPVIVLTLNHSRVESDLADKVVRFPLRRPGELSHRPILPYPPKYAAEHRLALIAEAVRAISRIDLAAAPLTHHTRFYDFEDIALLAARELGLEANFDPSLCITADAAVVDLGNLVGDRSLYPSRSAPAEELVEKTEGTDGHNLTELRETLRTFPHASAKARAVALCEDLERHFPHREVEVAGEPGRIVLTRRTDGGYTVSFVPLKETP